MNGWPATRSPRARLPFPKRTYSSNRVAHARQRRWSTRWVQSDTHRHLTRLIQCLAQRRSIESGVSPMWGSRSPLQATPLAWQCSLTPPSRSVSSARTSVIAESIITYAACCGRRVVACTRAGSRMPGNMPTRFFRNAVNVPTGFAVVLQNRPAHAGQR